MHPIRCDDSHSISLKVIHIPCLEFFPFHTMFNVLRKYKARGPAAWLSAMDSSSVEDVRLRRTWQYQDEKYFKPYVAAHADILTHPIHAGSTAAIFQPGAALDGRKVASLLRYEGHDADLQWVSSARVPENAVVKVSLAEDFYNPAGAGGGFIKQGATMSFNEIAAMRRLTRYKCFYTPKLYACCRFKINRGWFVSPAYLVVIVMEYVKGELLHGILQKVPEIAVQLAVKNALKDLRLYGIIHYDLHESNAIMTPSGRLVIIDFGYSLVVDVDSWISNPFRGETYDWEGFLSEVAKTSGLKGDPRKYMHLVGSNRNQRLADSFAMNPDPSLWNSLEPRRPNRRYLELDAGGDRARASLLKMIKSLAKQGPDAESALPKPVSQLVRSKLQADIAIAKYTKDRAIAKYTKDRVG